MPSIEPERTPAAPLEQNLESLVAIQRQEELKRTPAQRRVEYLSGSLVVSATLPVSAHLRPFG